MRCESQFLAAVRKAVERGLTKESALRALTTAPAELLGAADRVGSLEAGKSAHMVVTDGDLFEEKTKVLETWIDGRRFEVKKTPEHDVRGRWTVTLKEAVGGVESFEVKLEEEPESLKGAVIVEKIFSVPGLGRMLLTAINQRDYALVQGTVLVVALLFVATNTLVDVLYGWLDPRIRLG